MTDIWPKWKSCSTGWMQYLWPAALANNHSREAVRGSLGTIFFCKRFRNMTRRLNATETRPVEVRPIRFLLSLGIVAVLFGLLAAWFIAGA